MLTNRSESDVPSSRSALGVNSDSAEEHALWLGKLTGNLLSIEMMARIYVAIEDAGGDPRKTRPNLADIVEGDWVEISALSNKEDLRWALSTYNGRVKSRDPAFKVDVNKIVTLRDSLAHGRQFGMGQNPHLSLVKFSRKSNNGKVKVEWRVDMTSAWFREQTKILEEAILRITKALKWSTEQLA